MTETFNLGIKGLGVTLGYSTTSGGSFTTLAQIKSIDGPSFEVGTWESTGLASAAKEYLPTIFDGGEVSGHVIWNGVDTTHAAMLTNMQAYTLLYWKIVFGAPVGPGATGAGVTCTFAGYLTGLEVSGIEEESYAEAAFKIKVTGSVAIA